MSINYGELFNAEETQRIAQSMCELARECWDLGISDSTGFSISARVPGTDAIMVDKSGTGFRRNKITPQDLLLYDADGMLLYKPGGSENPRLAPVNTIIHLAGYKASAHLQGCIHWHDPYVIAFASKNLPIEPFSLQSKTIGTVECIYVDDREEKKYFEKNGIELEIPSGIHTRPEVLWVMQKVGQKAADIIASRHDELEKHGIAISHFEHGLFSWGRSVEEAFENGYRAYRNAQAILYSKVL